MRDFVWDVQDQTNLSFAVQQATHIEAQVWKTEYPEITYARDVPVDFSAHPFAATVTYFSTDIKGEAKFINGTADDVPLVNLTGNKHETKVEMAGIGYQLTLEEIGQAQLLGRNLDSEEAAGARELYERKTDTVAYLGDTTVGFEGLFNHSAVGIVAAAGVWSGLSADQILADFNQKLISAPWATTKGVEMVNTVRLPLAVYADIATRKIGPDSDMTILEFVERKNVYTAQTGQPLDIRGSYHLTSRAVAYHKSDRVLKIHIPMPFRFIAPQPKGLGYTVPGMFRIGGLDLRRPAAVVYMDGVVS